MGRTRITFLLIALIGACSPIEARSQQDSVLTYHGSPDRSGNFIVPGLTWERARSVYLDEKFRARVSGNVYAQPLYWRAAGSSSGMLLVATEDATVHASMRPAATRFGADRSASRSRARRLGAATSIRSASPARRSSMSRLHRSISMLP